MSIREDLALNIDSALGEVRRIDASLIQTGQNFQNVLAQALGVLRGVEVEVDTSSVQESLEEAVDGTDLEVNVGADTAGIPGAIDEAISSAGGADVPVDADTSAARASFDELGRTASDTARQATRDWNQVADQLQSVGRRASLGITAPFLAAAGAGNALSQSFDLSFSRITGLVGIASDEVEELRAGVLRLSRETTVGPRELADALFTVTSAGFRGAEALGILEQAAKAGAAGLGETRAITEALTGAVNAYGSDVLDASRATDILVATARAGNFEASQLAASLGRVTPFARQAQADFSDVGGAVALLTRVNNDAAQSVTQIAALLRGFVVPTRLAITAYDELGISAGEVRDIIGRDGLVAALQFLDESLDGNREKLGRLLGSSEAASAAFQILDADAETIAGTFGAVADSVGITEEAFGAYADTAAAESARAKAAIEESLIALGTAVQPVVSALAGLITTVAEFFSSLPPGAQTAVVAFGGVAAAVGPLLIVFGSILRNAQLLIATFPRIAAAAAASAGPIGIALAGVALVGAAFFQAGANAREAERRVQGFTDAIRQAGDVSSGVRQRISQMFEETDDRFLRLIDEAGISVDELADAAQRGGEAMEGLQRRLRAAGDALGENDIVVGAASRSLETLVEDVARAEERAERLGRVVGETNDEIGEMPTAIDPAVEAMLLMEEGAEDLESALQTAILGIDDLAGGANRLAAEFDESAGAFIDGIGSITDALVDLNDDGRVSLNEFTTTLQLNFLAQLNFVNNIQKLVERGATTLATELVNLSATNREEAATFAQEAASLNDEGLALQEERVRTSRIQNETLRRDAAEVFSGIASDTEREMTRIDAIIAGLDPDLTDTFNEISREFTRGWDNVRPGAEREADVAGRAIGRSLGGGAVAGVRDSQAEMDAELRKFITQAQTAAKRSAKISSPSRLFADEVGKPIGEGIAMGISEASQQVIKDAEALVRDAASAAGGATVAGGNNAIEQVLRSIEQIAANSQTRNAPLVGELSMIGSGDVRRDMDAAMDELRDIAFLSGV